MVIGRWGANASSALLYMVKSRGGSIGGAGSELNDNDRIGQIIFAVMIQPIIKLLLAECGVRWTLERYQKTYWAVRFASRQMTEEVDRAIRKGSAFMPMEILPDQVLRTFLIHALRKMLPLSADLWLKSTSCGALNLRGKPKPKRHRQTLWIFGTGS